MKIFQRFIAEIELIRFDFLQKKEIRWWKKHHPDFDIVMVGVPIKLSETARNLLRERHKKTGDQQMNSNIPKPCPFCGSHATIKSICGYEYKLGCGKCDVFFYGKTPREALDKWNRRHESEPEAAEPPPPEKPEFADDMLRAQGITTAHCGYCRHFSTHLECGGRMKGWQGHCISSKSTRTAVDADDYCPNFKDNRKG